ncbi:MAG: maltose acetyltransferase [Citrobacter freundii]|nr:MAG: maltose acetyltransferase [Citrobacter freundii]
MTEKQKMLTGQLYNAGEPDLLSDREQASGQLFEIFSIHPSRKEERQKKFRRLLGTVGNAFTIEKGFHCDYGYNIHIGENFFANVNFTVLDCAAVRIGNNVLIGPNVGIYTAGHPLDTEQRVAGLEFAYPVTIGDNVWIGGHVAILPGVKIGDNAVIGAGSVVTKNIPANVVAFGNPCKVIKEINK